MGFTCSIYYFGGADQLSDESASNGLVPYFLKFALDFSNSASIHDDDSGPAYTHVSSVYDNKAATWDAATSRLTITLQCNDCPEDGSGDHLYETSLHLLGTLSLSMQLSSDGYEQAVLDRYEGLYASLLQPMFVFQKRFGMRMILVVY